MEIRQFTVIVIAVLVSLSAIGVGYAQDKGKGGSEGIAQLYNAARRDEPYPDAQRCRSGSTAAYERL